MGRLVPTATLRGHTGRVWSLAWSASGLLATCGADCTVRVWRHSPTTGWAAIAISPADTFQRSVRDVAWSSDGVSLAAASFEATTTVLELLPGPPARLDPAMSLEGHDAEVKSVAYSSGGGLLATCARDRAVWIWEAGLDFDYECAAVLPGHTADVKCVAWHPRAELLVSTSFDGSARVWVEDADDWFCAETLVAHSGTVWGAAFDAAGAALATVGADACVVIWRRDEPPPAAIGQPPRFAVAGRVNDLCDEPIYTVDWRNGHDLLALGCGDDALRVLRRRKDPKSSATPTDSLDGGKGDDDAGDAHAKAAQVLTTRMKEVWNIDVCVERAHVGDINRVAWRRDGEPELATCGDDGVVRIWRYEEGENDSDGKGFGNGSPSTDSIAQSAAVGADVNTAVETNNSGTPINAGA